MLKSSSGRSSDSGFKTIANDDKRMLIHDHYVHNITIPDIWREQPEIIYNFLARQDDYEQFGLEVAYVLKRRLIEDNIEYSTIAYRVKSINSFIDKLERKHYADPFNDITDFTGVRVVCLYLSDLKKIESIIRRHFVLIEKRDTYKESFSDIFGYNAVHYLVKLGDEFSGARYDHLKNFTCEIQTRTVLQHAWATIDEHLVYKKKSSIPIEISESINKLSKVLEDADVQFEKLRQERAEYIMRLESTKFDDNFLHQEINLDSFRIFVERSFPQGAPTESIRNYGPAVKWLESSKCKTIGDIQKMVENAAPSLDWVVRELEEAHKRDEIDMGPWTKLQFVHISLVIADPDYRAAVGISRRFKKILKKLEKEKAKVLGNGLRAP
jgi:putative GTP pyrophosphokinase